MARTHFVLLSFVLLGCLLGESLAWNIKEIPIERDDKGLYLKTDLFPRRDYGLREGKFLLGLSHSQIIIADWCLFFDTHHCYDFHDYDTCPNRYNQPETTVEHHMFSGGANSYNLELYINNTLWFHGKETILTATCNSGATFYGSGRTGVIGMAIRSPWDYQVFSIFLNKNVSEGKLLFSFNSSMAKSTQPLTFSANSTWQIPINEGTFKLGSNAVPISGNLMFDPTADTIALPNRIYSYFMDWFKKVHNSYCWGGRGPHNDVCYNVGEVSKLQSIVLIINGQTIEIPGHIYAKQDKYTKDAVELNVRASDPNLSHESYVNPNFADSIILDSNVMSHYYSVFNQTRDQHTIQLYRVSQEDSQTTFFEKIQNFWRSLW